MSNGLTDRSVASSAKPAGAEPPYFLVDTDRLRSNVAELRQAFPGAAIFYALKANPTPIVLTTLADNDCGFEAASWGEIAVLIGLGVSVERIIYGTAVKPVADVERAVDAGVRHFAADSSEELVMLSTHAPGSCVFLRARVDDSHAVFHMSGSGKFGAPIDRLIDLVCFAADRDLVPWGLSFSVGSQGTSASAWAEGIRSLLPVVEALHHDGINLERLNIGGGFPITYANHVDPPKLQDIASHVERAMSELPYQPGLVIEPGRALVATAVSLTASVLARVERSGGSWLYLDVGVYNALFEAMPGQGSTRYAVESAAGDSSGEVATFTLAGPTGDGIDIMDTEAELPSGTEVGDQLTFRNVGAYTLAMSSTFNGFPVPTIRVRTSGVSSVTASANGAIDTRATRLAIGFPSGPADWCRAPAEFSTHDLRILGHPVMQDWEADYMQALAAVVARQGGVVLELGYGLGLAAAAIQSCERVEQHVVIECHPDVIARCLVDRREAIASQRLQLLVGLWQQVTPRLADATFDGILFDTYPLSADQLHSNHYSFFAEAHRLLKPGGVMTYYSDEAERLSEEHLRSLVEAGFAMDQITTEICPVRPPDDCEYWQHTSLVVPVVRKVLE